MHAIVTTLTTATLLFHSIIGCCWGSVALTTESDAAVVACGSSSCCAFGQVAASHSHDEAGHDQAPCSPRPGQSQCHGVCTYVLPQKAAVDHVQPQVCQFSLATFGLSLASQAISHSFYAVDAYEPPIRLHLLNQILLV